MSGVQVQGIEEMLRQIERIGGDVERVKEKAIKKGANVVRTEMAQKCERSTEQGRHVADNIIVSEIKTSGGEKYVDIGPSNKNNNEFFYAKMLEFGTTKMRAKPFMEPAAIEKGQECLDKMADVIREAIR